MKRFWFDGKCCTDFGIIASGSVVFNSPERDIETISILGRNGDLLWDNGRFKNIVVSYPAFISHDFARNAAAARAWLLRNAGYRRLEDNYNPGTYRMAMFAGPMDFDMKFLNRAGEVTLSFNCKPQRYLLDGERLISFAAPGTLRNPTAFAAKPLITVHSSVSGSGIGSVTVGGTTVQFHVLRDGTILDCDVQNAYTMSGGGLMNMNNILHALNFPELQPGENEISWTGGVTGVDIVPRWWTL